MSRRSDEVRPRSQAESRSSPRHGRLSAVRDRSRRDSRRWRSGCRARRRRENPRRRLWSDALESSENARAAPGSPACTGNSSGPACHRSAFMLRARRAVCSCLLSREDRVCCWRAADLLLSAASHHQRWGLSATGVGGNSGSGTRRCQAPTARKCPNGTWHSCLRRKFRNRL